MDVETDLSILKPNNTVGVRVFRSSGYLLAGTSGTIAKPAARLTSFDEKTSTSSPLATGPRRRGRKLRLVSAK